MTAAFIDGCAQFYLNSMETVLLNNPLRLCVQQLADLLLSALNQNQVQFTLRPGVQVTVYAAHLSAGKSAAC